MLHAKSLAVLLASGLAVSAQSDFTIIKVFVPSADKLGSQVVVGSVINVDSSAVTTLALQCGSNTSDEECAVNGGLTVTQGPSTAVMSSIVSETVDPVVVTMGWECRFGGTTTADCTYKYDVSVTASADSSLMGDFNYSTSIHSSSTIGLSGTDLASAYLPVTVTAGASKLGKGAAPTPSPTPTSTPAPTTPKSTPISTQASTGTGPANSTPTPGAANHVKIGGLAIAGVFGAVLML